MTAAPGHEPERRRRTADLSDGGRVNGRRRTGILRVRLFASPGDPALRRVVDGDLHRYPVAEQYFDIVHTKLAGDMRGNDHIVRQFYLEGRVREHLHDDAFKFDHIILRQINLSSL